MRRSSYQRLDNLEKACSLEEFAKRYNLDLDFLERRVLEHIPDSWIIEGKDGKAYIVDFSRAKAVKILDIYKRKRSGNVWIGDKEGSRYVCRGCQRQRKGRVKCERCGEVRCLLCINFVEDKDGNIKLLCEECVTVN